MATDHLAIVLTDVEFPTANGSTVCMRKDEQVLVLEKTNNKWWKVVRSGDQQPFYAPAAALQERTVPRVRLRGGTGSVRDRRRAPLSAVDAERHISGHEDSPGSAWGWHAGAASSPGGGPAVPRSSSMDDVLAESPSRAGHSWHRRQSWAPERHAEGRPAAGPLLPEPVHSRSRSYQLETSRTHGSDQHIAGAGRPRPSAAAAPGAVPATGGTWERAGPPPVQPGASSTWERGATTAPRTVVHGASNTWERGGRVADPQPPPPDRTWERKGTSGPIAVPGGGGGGGGGSRDQTDRGGTWERGKDSVRVRGPMAMSWQSRQAQAQAPVPPPRVRHALPGAAGAAAEASGFSAGHGGVNQSAPSLAFDAFDARRPSPGALAVRRGSPSSLSDLRAQRPDLSDGHNDSYRRTAERLAGRSESPRPPPAVVSAVADSRSEGLWMNNRGVNRTPVRPDEAAGSGRPVVPPRPSRRPAAAPAEHQQQHQQPQQQQPAVHPQVDRSAAPPVPHILDTPRRQLTGSWAEYALADGTSYFYNVETGVSSWQPPPEPPPASAVQDDGELSSCESLYSESESCSDSPLCSPRLGGGAGADVPLPDGWRRRRDTMGQLCFVRDTSPTRWFSGLNSDGHVYFFAEGSTESQWALPPAHGRPAASVTTPPTDEQISHPSFRNRHPLPAAHPPVLPAKGPPPPAKPPKPPRPSEGGGGGGWQPSDLGSGWPQLRAGEGPLLVIRQGTLSCRIKLSRRKAGGGGGSAVKQVKLWRHWAACHLALTDSFLLLFTDANDPASIEWGSPTHLPLVTVHLAGANLVTDSTASSKKNVLQLTTRHGMQVLLRDDNTTTVKVWADALRSAISDLPSEVKPLLPPIVAPKPHKLEKLEVQRSPSMRRAANDNNSHSASESDSGTAGSSLEPPSLTRENSRIKRRLKGFFSARPSAEELKRSGILKDERVFGRSLVALCEADHSTVPRFVEYCIEAIESEPAFLRTEGLYRVSAGLDQIQRLRCQVDQENYSVLADETDPHVLAGALKLFFRELPQPLLPGGEAAEPALRAAESPPGRARTDVLRALVAALEPAHRSTLQLLLRHLSRVSGLEASNRMGPRNLSVVFGPTLTRQPEGDPLSHTAEIMRQNVLVEALLVDFQKLFPAAGLA